MTDFLFLLGKLALILFVYMTGWFFVSILKKRNDVADIAWGLGFLLVVSSVYLPSGISIDRGLLSLILVSIWAIRLSTHIYLRNRGKKEDYRYQNWRMQWGKWFYLRTYFQVFLLQGIFLLLISMPAVASASFRGANWNIFDIVGLAVWLFGFLFEAVGDWQLRRFINNPTHQGKLMQRGLWRYTRHPNYFGEVTQWWGLWIISLSTPVGILSLIGPLTITFLIIKVSGIPLLEEKMKTHPDFSDYARRTSKFFPWIPRS